MASASSKLSLKRQRPDAVDGDARHSTRRTRQIRNSIDATLLVENFYDGYSSIQSTHKRAGCSSQMLDGMGSDIATNASNCIYGRSRDRFFQNQTQSVYAFLVSFALLFFSSTSTSRFVRGQSQYHNIHNGNLWVDKIGNNLYRSWDEGKDEGNYPIFRYNRGRVLSSVYNKKQQQGGCTHEKERGLAGEALGSFIRQQKSDNLEENLPAKLRTDTSAESFRDGQPPNESNVSTPVDESTGTLLDYGDSMIKGNPLIQSRLPMNFQFDLLVKNTITNRLLNGLKAALEDYIQSEYQKIIDGESTGGKNTYNVTMPAPKTLKLEDVVLNLSLVESKWWQERRKRRLNFNSTSFGTSTLRLRRRELQEQQQSTDTKLMTIDADGSVYYSMEVDGSAPTPDDIEQQWSEAYVEMMSQNQLRRAIENADIQGVVRLNQVEIQENSSGLSNNTELADGSDGNGNGNEDDGLDQKDTTNNANNDSLYKDNISEYNNELSGNKVEGKKSQLERPSTLSIIFGFILTGIAILGLFAYAYIFYRKRQKRLKKKKKMKESITFSSASAAVATANAASKKNQNSPYFSKNTVQSTSHAPATPQSSQIHMNRMMLSQTESEETSYKGLESSIGSEDALDSFANELRQAASLDQEAWEETHRKKTTMKKIEVSPLRSTSHIVNKNHKSSISGPVPPLLPNDHMDMESEEELDDVIEAKSEGNTSWVSSFPYGDEAQDIRRDDDIKPVKSSTSNPWEPYNSNLSMMEEKKDETSPSEFFAQKLKTIERDLNVAGGPPLNSSRTNPIQANAPDDNLATSDILSEVSELSRYVRRYERRKDRKNKREEFRHDRLGASDGAPAYSFAPQTMSIRMDGNVYKPHNSNNHVVSTPPSTRGPQTVSLSSYADSYRDAQQHEMAVLDSMSFVSDEGTPEDRSTRSQRLGISPYSVSNDEVYYKNGALRTEDNSSSNRSPTLTSRTRSTRSEDDYRYSVGYSHDYSKSSSSRLADLRSTDAIIDNSNSEVNVNYDIPNKPRNTKNDRTATNRSAANSDSGVAPLNFKRLNKTGNTGAVVKAANPQRNSDQPKASSSNNRFDKLRGMFEQKTNEQPDPIYPPGENWQNGGSFGK